MLLAGFLCLPAASLAGSFTEGFASNPAAQGWKTVGDPALFHWNGTEGKLEVTWDSSKTNSYFARPLGTVLGLSDDFSFSFDLELSSFKAGVTAEAPYGFQVSVALLNLASATEPGFLRGTGSDAPNLVEFSFFPDPGGDWQYGPSLTTAMIDSTGVNWSTGGFSNLGLESNTAYRITVSYTGADQVLRATVSQGETVFAALSHARPSAGFKDLAVDHFAICSYSGAGQFPGFAGSVLAHGTIDNIAVTTSRTPPVSAFAMVNSKPEVRISSRADRKYSLERSTDLQLWEAISPATPGTGEEIALSDANPPAGRGYYRVKIEP